MAWNEIAQEQYERSSDRFETDGSNEEQAVTAPLLSPPSKTRQRPVTDSRKVFNAIRFMFGTGCQQRTSEVFSAVQQVWNYFYVWRDTASMFRFKGVSGNYPALISFFARAPHQIAAIASFCPAAMQRIFCCCLLSVLIGCIFASS